MGTDAQLLKIADKLVDVVGLVRPHRGLAVLDAALGHGFVVESRGADR